MIVDYFLIAVGLTGLFFASLFDLKTREVPDWISYALVVSGLGLRLLAALSGAPWSYFLYGVLGAGLLFAFGMTMYYTRQWGGGDAKLFMGLGAVFATNPFHDYFLLGLIPQIFLVGVLYGLAWSAFLAVRHRVRFWSAFKNLLMTHTMFHRLSLGLALAALVSVFLLTSPFLRFALAISALFLLLYLYLYLFIKAVEKACLYKTIAPSQLVEGDWIAEDVYHQKTLLVSKRTPGIEKPQIEALKKAGIRHVLVRDGIPFVPPFFLGTLVTLYYGNLFLALL